MNSVAMAGGIAALPSSSVAACPRALSAKALGHRAPKQAPQRHCVVASAKPADGKPEQKLWGGRFEEPVCPIVEKFGQSVSYDQKLYKVDLQGSRAHAAMLAKQGLMTEADRDAIFKGLDTIEKDIESGKFVWRADREDVHMNIEATLTERVGEPAKKLHTARSRNDQVITDVRLWVRNAIDETIEKLTEAQKAMMELALQNEGLVIPGYTHMQRAQPVLLQHELLAYIEWFERDKGRLADCRARANYCPLGACAMAGTGLPIDRFQTSASLGFTAPMANSMDAVADRDFLIEFLAANAIIGVHMSRIAEQWVLFATEEYGFMIPSDAVSTGSSIMPQKKNPDPMEILRGKSARVIGSLVTVLTLCKGLGMTYNRDLQEDKEPLFDSTETIHISLDVLAEFARRVTFNRDRIAKSLPRGHLDATTMADYLVRKGMPFRTSHDVVGRAVALAVKKGCELKELSMDEFKALDPIIEQDVYGSLGVDNCIAQFTSYGSTGIARVAEQMATWKKKLGYD
eukprot:jgi/Mesvir1/7892/Mv11824-RA.1